MCDLNELLKDKIDHAIRRIGKRHEVALMMGTSETELSWWCNKDHPRFIPLDHLADLNRLSGGWLMKELAHEMAIDAAPARPQNIFQIIGNFSQACGHLAMVALRALADGVVTKTEAREVHHAARPVSDNLHDLNRAF